MDKGDAPISCGQLFLTDFSLFSKFNPSQSKFLVRQAKSGKSILLRSQHDKVSRTSEPVGDLGQRIEKAFRQSGEKYVLQKAAY